MLKMVDLDLKGKRVLIRVDFNVPIKEGKIMSENRLLASFPTLKLALEKGASVIVISHLGQPTEGVYDEAFSLKPVADWLSKGFGKSIRFEKDWLNGLGVNPGELVLCENVRFNLGEKKNSEELAKKMADLCDVFVMDAFATAHRAQASTYGVAKFAKVAAAGPLLVQEVEALSAALKNPKQPLLAVTAGSKVSTKLHLLENLLTKVNYLILGGGIANTFLLAQGNKIGKSLCEASFIEKAKEILAEAKKRQVEIVLPMDVVVAEEISDSAVGTIKALDEIKDEDIILDVGPKSREYLAKTILKAGTVIWNGPVGMFEINAFSKGTEAVALAIIEAKKKGTFTLVGGGDTVAAIEKFNLEFLDFSYVSTAGGAFLEYMEGISLPAVEILEERE